jgi:hypothetical protein
MNNLLEIVMFVCMCDVHVFLYVCIIFNTIINRVIHVTDNRSIYGRHEVLNQNYMCELRQAIFRFPKLQSLNGVKNADVVAS